MDQEKMLPPDVAKTIKQDRWTPAELSYTFGDLNAEGLLRLIAAQNELIIELVSGDGEISQNDHLIKMIEEIRYNTEKKPVGRPRKEQSDGVGD